jgi:hypothetical protein
MWIRKRPLVLARMPSLRQFPLNPRPPAAPAVPVAMPVPDVVAESTAPTTAAAAELGLAAAGGSLPDAVHVRAGGFHESSYELHHGLQVSESEWSEDLMVPAPQDAH